MTQTEASTNNDINAVTTDENAEASSTAEADLSVLSTWIQDDDDDDNGNKDPFQIVRRKTKLQILTSRQAFEERLKTFHSLTYFCKPTSLSPIVCARFG